MSALDHFSAPTRAWFEAAFARPTTAQEGAWDAIAAGKHALVVAPTGSGKTLSAFLHAIDSLLTAERPDDRTRRTRVLYISPLKALAVDVERNLRAPLTGIRHTAERLGTSLPDLTVGLRSGDTSAADRRRLTSTPPDIMITTPESLFLMLTSQARESLRGIDTVILDEVHAVAGGKRGAHLAVSLERLDALLDRPAQRIGLSATVRPLEEVARFLGGSEPVEIVAPPSEKEWDLRVVVPVEDMTAPEEYDEESGDPQRATSIWPHVEEHVVDLVEQHRSTIVFANSRRLAERLTARLNEIATDRAGGEAGSGAETDARPDQPPAQVMAQSGQSGGAGTIIAKAHHGSVSKEQRALIEDDLKRGRLPCVVATSSLELGIDMGAVDLVIQIESPPSVASALQRVGRAGHQVGEVSRGVLFPKHRGDLAQTAVAVERMRSGAIESLSVPTNPLDVLAQHVVACTAMEDWEVDDLYDLVRRAAPYSALPRSAFDATLDLLSGRYPSEEFAELRPRIVWDRVTGVLSGRPGAQRLAVTSGGTIPDRGLFGVFLVGDKASRVGELDEEMVYESRVGDIFALGATSWRIEDITHDRVLVTPAPGIPGRLPFWKGDSLGRPAELGEAIGSFTRELGSATPATALQRARDRGLDEYAAGNLITYVTEQQEATNALPSDTQLLVERFRDELGDWRLVVHSPYGTPVHAPWALAINARLRERYDIDGQAVASDDGIVIRIPDTENEPPGGDVVVFEPDEIEQLVTQEVGGSALFASRFRECAARALLLPRRDPGRRSPLWQQRQRSAQLLEVASQYPSFPIVLEAIRECLQDVYDLPALVTLLQRVQRREVTVVDVATQSPSPYARSLLFGYVAQFVYEGDSPIAERRAAALSLDQGLLAELLGRAELRELLDPEVLAEVESELQWLAPDRRARDAEAVADLLRLLGPLSAAEITARSVEGADVDSWLSALADVRRVVPARMAGDERWTTVEDVGRLRDGLGVPVPPGTPDVFTEPHEDPIGDLIARYARTHGPFTTADVAARLGLGEAVARHALQRLVSRGRLLEGEFRPSGSGQRVVRRRGAAQAAPPLAGPVAQGGRAGHPGHRGALPARVAAGRRQAPRRRRGGGRHRPARRLPGAGQRPGAARAGRAGPRLRAVLPRRAHRVRRGRVGGPLPAARQRRLGQPPPRRPGRPHPARRGRGGARRGGACRPGGARRRRRVVLPPALRPGRLHQRLRALRGAVVAGVAGAPHQRHRDAAAGAGALGQRQPPDPAHPAPAARRWTPGSPGRWTDARTQRTSRDGGALGAAARARLRPDPPCACHRRAPPRAPRRRHPRCRDERAGARRLRRGLQGAVTRSRTPVAADAATSSRASAPRSSAPPGPSTGCAPSASGPTPSPARSPWPPPTRPTSTARRWPGPRRSRARRPGTDPGARPARSWSWSTATSRSTSSAVAGPCSRGATTRTGWSRPPPHWPTPPGAAPSASSPSSSADGAALLGGGVTPLRAALDEAGFVATPKGLRMRA